MNWQSAGYRALRTWIIFGKPSAMNWGWTHHRQAGQYRGMALSALLLALVAPVSADAASVQSVRVDGQSVVIALDDVVDNASTLVLAQPGRIAIDIAGADPGNAAKPTGPVTAIRQGRFTSSTARIVLDLASPALVRSGQFSADGKTLTLSLTPASDAEFQSAATGTRKRYLPPETHRAKPPRSKYSITIPLDPAPVALTRPAIQGPKGRPLVVIDAGHGGHDPGAISPHGGVREKDVVLGVAKAIRDELLAAGRFRVAMTRDNDRFLVLGERSAIARNLGADLFISVHADSAGAAEASGATIYTLSDTASDEVAARLANRENKADILNGVNLGKESSDVASILVDLAQRDSMNASATFAKLVRRESATDLSLRADYHKMAGFAVLKAPDMASILLETGYLTNATDVDRLNSAAGRKRIASGLRRAIDIHFAQRLAAR